MGAGKTGLAGKVYNSRELTILLTGNRFPWNKTTSWRVLGVPAIFLAVVGTLYQWELWSYTVGEEAQS